MANGTAADGTVRRAGDGYELRFERFLAHPVAKVWAALTESDELAQWLAPAVIEQVPGGRAHLAFTNSGHVFDGTVLTVEPPRLLEYTWGTDHGSVRWELSPVEGGTRLALTHAFPERGDGALFLAGWHTHLELLVLALAGQPSPWPWPRWHELHDHYATREETV